MLKGAQRKFVCVCVCVWKAIRKEKIGSTSSLESAF